MAGKKNSTKSIGKENGIVKPSEGISERTVISGIIRASNEGLLGNYSNFALIHHTRFEFVFDFILALNDQNILASRVITSPQHAKKLHEALGANIAKYEEKYEKIILGKEDPVTSD